MELSKVQNNEEAVTIQFVARKRGKVLGSKCFTVRGATLNQVYNYFKQTVLKLEKVA